MLETLPSSFSFGPGLDQIIPTPLLARSGVGASFEKDLAMTYDPAWYQVNKKKVNEWNRRWREANKEQMKAIVKRWYLAHPDRVRENRRRWYLENKERWLENARNLPKKEPEKWKLIWAEKRGVRRARKAGSDIGRVELRRILNIHGYICHICKAPVAPWDIHFDHVIPLSKGGSHTEENIRPAHADCNLRKQDKI